MAYNWSDFFSLWLTTRIKERGWPQRKGTFKKKVLVDAHALTGALQDAVRIAVSAAVIDETFSRSVVSPFALEAGSQTRSRVDAWIESQSLVAESKLASDLDFRPSWFLLTALNHRSLEDEGGWNDRFMNANEGEEMVEFPSEEFLAGLAAAESTSATAMAWGISNPSRVQSLFDDPRLSVDSDLTFQGWVHMAEILVAKFKAACQAPSYLELPD